MAGKKDSKGKATGKLAAKKSRGRVPKYKKSDVFTDFILSLTDGAVMADIPDILRLKYGDDAPCERTLYNWLGIIKGEDEEKSAELLQSISRACEGTINLLKLYVITSPIRMMKAAKNPDTTQVQYNLENGLFNNGFRVIAIFDPAFNEKKSVELTGADGKDLIPAPGLPPEQMNELAVRIAEVREETRRKRMEAAGDE